MPLLIDDAAAATLAMFSWQALSARYNYDGNWTTAFYATGANEFLPPELTRENIWKFPNTGGGDG